MLLWVGRFQFGANSRDRSSSFTVSDSFFRKTSFLISAGHWAVLFCMFSRLILVSVLSSFSRMRSLASSSNMLCIDKYEVVLSVLFLVCD